MLEKDLRGRRKIEKRSRKEKELRIRDNHPLPSFTHVRQTLGSMTEQEGYRVKGRWCLKRRRSFSYLNVGHGRKDKEGEGKGRWCLKRSHSIIPLLKRGSWEGRTREVRVREGGV